MVGFVKIFVSILSLCLHESGICSLKVSLKCLDEVLVWHDFKDSDRTQTLISDTTFQTSFDSLEVTKKQAHIAEVHTQEKSKQDCSRNTAARLLGVMIISTPSILIWCVLPLVLAHKLKLREGQLKYLVHGLNSGNWNISKEMEQHFKKKVLVLRSILDCSRSLKEEPIITFHPDPFKNER